jgi:hypothetical protein
MGWLLASGEVLTGAVLIALGALWTWFFSGRKSSMVTITVLPIISLLLIVVGGVFVLSGMGLM